MAGNQTVRAAVVCHKGCVRSNNEDNFFFNGCYMSLEKMNEGAVMEHTFTTKCQLYGLFDGMGGGDWGERASALAAQSMQSVYLDMNSGDAAKMLREYALRTNARIVEDGRSQHVDTQGTTMAVVLLRGNECHVANVGDSRVYLMRDNKLAQVSVDHSLVGDMVRRGQMTPEQARKSPKNNVITQYLGMPDDERPQELTYYKKVDLHKGDRLMLCTDGLCDLLSASAIEERMATTASPRECASLLVMTALELGGKDNTTCIVLDIGSFQTRLPSPADGVRLYPGVVEKNNPRPAQDDQNDADDTAQIRAAAQKAAASRKIDEDTSLL